MTDRKEHRKSSHYRDIAARLRKEIPQGSYSIGNLLAKVQVSASFSTAQACEIGVLKRRSGSGSPPQ